MGSLSAYDMAHYGSLRQGLTWHLTSNHYPPVPSSMVQVCVEAIEAFHDEDYDRTIHLPEGVSWRNYSVVPAHVVVDEFHLDPWVSQDLEHDEDME